MKGWITPSNPSGPSHLSGTLLCRISSAVTKPIPSTELEVACVDRVLGQCWEAITEMLAPESTRPSSSPSFNFKSRRRMISLSQ